MKIFRFFILALFCLSIAYFAIFSQMGPGLNDWGFALPNHYQMWKVNSNTILIGLESSPGSLISYNREGDLIGIPAHIVKKKKNERYLCAQVIAEETVVATTTSEVDVIYYVLDTAQQFVYGPIHGKDDYTELLDHVGITNLEDWNDTSDIPIKRDTAVGDAFSVSPLITPTA